MCKQKYPHEAWGRKTDLEPVQPHGLEIFGCFFLDF